MEPVIAVTLLGLFRIFALTAERIAIHGLGEARQGSLATMGISFGGASVVLWAFALHAGQMQWVASTMWTGMIYAAAFGLYTKSLVTGPVSTVSPWTNATVVLLWIIHPFGGMWSWIGLSLFAIGAAFLTTRPFNMSVVWMLASDALLAIARLIDVHHVAQPEMAYAASLFTAIGLWMMVPTILFDRVASLTKLFFIRPVWSITAASSNAFAYLALFAMLRFVHPAVIEAISTMASVAATLFAIIVFKEGQGGRKIFASVLMTLGTICLLVDVHV